MTPVLIKSLMLLLALVVLSAISQWRHASRKTHMKAWEALAASPDLYLKEDPEPYERQLVGLRNGILVEVTLGPGRTGGSFTLCSRILAQIHAPMPPGFQMLSRAHLSLNPLPQDAVEIPTEIEEIDKVLVATCADPDKLKQIFLGPSLREELTKLAKLGGYVQINSELITVELGRVVGRDLPEILDLVAGIARAMPEQHEKPWMEFSQQHGLLYMGAGPEGDFIIRGKYEGVRVMVRCEIQPRRLPVTTIRATIEGHLPKGLVIRRRNSPRRWGLETGDAQMDDLLSISGTNTDQVIHYLGYPELRKALLTVNKEAPGILVEMGQLIVQYPGMLSEHLARSVDAVVGMVMIMRDAGEVWHAAKHTSSEAVGY